MAVYNKGFSVNRAASVLGVPVDAVRRIVDRLKLGTRVGQIRVVFVEELPTLAIAFRSHGYDIPDNFMEKVDDEELVGNKS